MELLGQKNLIKKKYFALEAFEKAYLDDKYSNHGLNALVNFMCWTELRKFEKYLDIMKMLKQYLVKMRNCWRQFRVYLFQHKVEERQNFKTDYK